MLFALAALCGLTGFVIGIIILVHAFSKGGVVQGLLSLFIPFYILYYAFAKFEHEKKGMILAAWFGAILLQFVLMFMGVGAAIMTGGGE
jgi:hypothetical protein